MKSKQAFSRRTLIRSSAFGLLSVPLSVVSASNEIIASSNLIQQKNKELFHRYPSIDDEVVAKVVSKSHSDLEAVKALVDKRPELARATWDWAFGDWETAIGAASHVGRRDIISYLLSKGARPNIFTFASLGAYNVVKSMIEFSPGIQHIEGPHGFNLLFHAEVGLRMKDEMTKENITACEKLIDYLKSSGNINEKKYLEVADKNKYLGDYRYGEGEKDGFTIQLNMRKMLSLGRIGKFGGALFKIGDKQFAYNGAPSVEISFQFQGEKVVSLTVKEPDFVLVAKKVS